MDEEANRKAPHKGGPSARGPAEVADHKGTSARFLFPDSDIGQYLLSISATDNGSFRATQIADGILIET